MMKIENKKGQAQLAPIFALVAFAIVLVVGVMIFSTFDTQANSIVSATSAAGGSIGNLTQNFYSGSNIMSIGPIVLAALIILAVVSLLSRAR